MLGTGMLVATVVGSGIMAERLADGNMAVALLGNTIATGAILFVLITMLGPVSGAHLNPAVTMVFALRRELPVKLAGPYVAAQILGGVLGTFAANLMFELPIVELSMTERAGPAQWFSEFVATFALVFTILGTLRARPEAVPIAVALVITAGYWFTASTSFANPAVTIARALSDTFAGIAPVDVPAFILAQLLGAAAAFLIAGRVFGWNPANSVKAVWQRRGERGMPERVDPAANRDRP
jgi:glycerol uptake facilitator-like aquaporin